MSGRTVRIVSKTRLIASIAILLSLIFVCLYCLSRCHRRERENGKDAANTAAATDYAPVDVQLSSEQAVTPAPKDTEGAAATEQLTSAPANTPEPEPSPEPTPAPTEAAPATATPTTAPTAVPTQAMNSDGYPALHSQSGKLTYYGDTGIFRVDNSAYEGSGYVDSIVTTYAGIVNNLADQLAGRTQVYSMIIPTGYAVTLPDDVRSQVQQAVDQPSCMDIAYTHFSSRVKAVPCWDSLMRHRNEYIYFRTDHHWTQRGAYYAYECFCRAKGVSPYTMSQREEVEYSGFLGTFYKGSGNDSALLPADTIHAWLPMSSSATMRFYENDGTVVDWPIVLNVNSYVSAAKYAAFAGGDHGLTEFKNPEVDSGVLIVIKDSFGNALMPLLVDHYSRIYEIDFRYWHGSLREFAIEKGATDMLFALNFQNISNRSGIAKLSGIA